MLLYSGTTNEQFTKFQKGIAYYFKGDPSVINPARVMRLPGYDWVKPKKNCARFSVRIIRYHPVRYYFHEIETSFPFVSEEDYQTYKQKVSGKGRISAHNNSFSYYNDITRSIYVGTYPEEEVLVDDRGQAIEYLKRINPAKYLGVEPQKYNISLPCPFHEDTQPSAHLYKYENELSSLLLISDSFNRTHKLRVWFSKGPGQGRNRCHHHAHKHANRLFLTW